MRFGINTFLFTSPFTNDSTRWFPMFKKWGFDGVEIALEDPANIDPAFIREELDQNRLRADVICAAMGPGRDLRGTPEQQAEALNYLTTLLGLMPTLGSSLLVGPLYSEVGRAGQTSPEEYERQWNLVVGHLRTLADRAESLDLRLAIEPLNRFETDFINTGEQGLRLVEAVGSPALGLHLDTFHMNIEEKSLPETIRRAGAHLWHLHTCGNDRGTPGNDHTDWPGVAAALRDIDYRGYATIESFTVDVKAIAKAAAIWRQIEPSREEIAVKGLGFLKGVMPA
ncbi:MAG: sugar phosphate isomerase/epimerase [Sphingobacteriaceae bacterium]|nr:sugar phosphate isomerase/epimerase [Cytophagaceae bacterium]